MCESKLRCIRNISAGDRIDLGEEIIFEDFRHAECHVALLNDAGSLVVKIEGILDIGEVLGLLRQEVRNEVGAGFEFHGGGEPKTKHKVRGGGAAGSGGGGVGR